jgi:histidyl-tRNA synthetase
MKRADRSQARYTLVLGGDEVSSGQALLKPMAGGEPVPVTLKALAAELRRRKEVG